MPAEWEQPGDEHRDNDDVDDRELPDPSDMDQDDYTVMSRCPNCRKMIDEQSEICPRCGYFINTEEQQPTSPAGWLWIAVVIVLVILTIGFAIWH